MAVLTTRKEEEFLAGLMVFGSCAVGDSILLFIGFSIFVFAIVQGNFQPFTFLHNLIKRFYLFLILKKECLTLES